MIFDKIQEIFDLKAVTDVEGEKINVTADKHKIACENATKLKKGDGVKLVLRPEAVHLEESGDIEVKVVLSTFMGSYQLYHVMQGDNLVKITDYNPRGKKVFEVGEKAYLSFSDNDVHPLPGHEDIKVETIYLD